MSPPPPPVEAPELAPQGRLRDLLADGIGYAGMRLVWVGIVTMLATLAEAAGLLLLLPLLAALGISGDSPASVEFLHIPQGAVSLEAALAIYILVMFAATAVVTWRNLLFTRLRQGFIDHQRLKLHRAILNMETRALLRYRRTDLLYVLGADVNRTGEGVLFLLRIAGAFVQVPVLLAIAFALSPQATGVALGLALLIALALRPLDRGALAVSRAMGPAGARMMGAADEDLVALLTVKSLGIERDRIAHFEESVRSARARQIAWERGMAMVRAARLVLSAVAVAIVVWTCVNQLDVPLANMVVVIVAIARVLPLVGRTFETRRTLMLATPAHASLRALQAAAAASREAEIVHGDVAATDTAGPARLRLDDVVLHWRNDTSAGLDGATLQVPAGGLTAVIGASGAGKTSLALVLTGLLAPDAGTLAVDGQVLDAGALRAWRRRTVLMPQDPVLFHDTVAANLRKAAPDADAARMRVALQRAGAGFAFDLPEGLETVVGERGTRLSGGERQRIALARALLLQPRLLVLDEPTAALDPAGEARILEVLRDLATSTTVVVITHRPAVARMADHVVVMDHGRCVGAAAWPDLDPATLEMIGRIGL